MMKRENFHFRRICARARARACARLASAGRPRICALPADDNGDDGEWRARRLRVGPNRCANARSRVRDGSGDGGGSGSSGGGSGGSGGDGIGRCHDRSRVGGRRRRSTNMRDGERRCAALRPKLKRKSKRQASASNARERSLVCRPPSPLPPPICRNDRPQRRARAPFVHSLALQD